jgi:hypothetical protein
MHYTATQYLRWYIDDQFVYEVNKNALLARTNASGAEVGQRLIPLEAVYIIFNLGMSEDFGQIDYDTLTFPSQMLVDYIRCGRSRPSGRVLSWVACFSGWWAQAEGAALCVGATQRAVQHIEIVHSNPSNCSGAKPAHHLLTPEGACSGLEGPPRLPCVWLGHQVIMASVPSYLPLQLHWMNKDCCLQMLSAPMLALGQSPA